MQSADHGHTWTAPVELVKGDVGGRGPVKNKPIMLSGGAILAPASIEAAVNWNGFTELWDAFVDVSYDNGLTWSKSIIPLDHEALASHHDKALKATGVIQPTLWESAAGHVHMLMRSTGGRMYRSDSADGGATWCEAYPTELPNNNSGIDLVKLDNGLLALAFNPVSSTWGKRTPLVIRLSADNGANWDNEFVLEDEPGGYAYPALVAKGGDLYVTYTWKRERIAFRKIHIDQ
jgi:predicted neuraminidase